MHFLLLRNCYLKTSYERAHQPLAAGVPCLAVRQRRILAPPFQEIAPLSSVFRQKWIHLQSETKYCAKQALLVVIMFSVR